MEAPGVEPGSENDPLSLLRAYPVFLQDPQTPNRQGVCGLLRRFVSESPPSAKNGGPNPIKCRHSGDLG